MSLNQRRALSNTANPLNKVTKATVVEECQRQGGELSITKVNVGEWNENRRFSMKDNLLWVAMKGESPDWEAMLEELTKT
ncbi:MAG: hypothetical protein V3V40_06025 [Nitrosomonadaceae bacterium]